MFFRTLAFVSSVFMFTSVFAEAPSPEIKAKVDAKIKELAAWSTDAKIVAEVKSANNSPIPEANGMTQEKWEGLTVLSPEVKAFSKNALASYLKSKKEDSMAEIFVSAANGTKVAFLSKTTNWSHKGKPKHDNPMNGKTWVGQVEVDQSAGKKEIQISLPVFDGNKAIGSIVVGFDVTKL